MAQIPPITRIKWRLEVGICGGGTAGWAEPNPVKHGIGSLQQSALSMVKGKKGISQVPVIRQAAAQQDSTLLDGAALTSP